MIMEISFPGGKKVDATFDDFTVRTDQPVKYGGDGTAPAPFDLFIASLGTCAGFYVAAFCEKRNISTSGIKVLMETEVNEKTKMTERIAVKITLPQDFPEKYRTAAVKAAEKCFVAKHLTQPPMIDVFAT